MIQNRLVGNMGFLCTGNAEYQGRVVPDSFTYGTSAQRKEWFRKGWVTGDLAKGNTFKANI